MTMIMTSVPGRTNSSVRKITETLKHRWDEVLENFLSSAEGSRKTKEAIAILRSGDASPDSRDWAEHYLCGFAQAVKARFFEDRRWQS